MNICLDVFPTTSWMTRYSLQMDTLVDLYIKSPPP